MYLRFQYPVEIPGVGNLYFLRTARNGYLVKVALAVGLTPLIYLGHGLLRRHFHVTEVLVHDTPDSLADRNPA